MPEPSGTVTFLFTDIEGSTRLWQRDEEAMRSALSRHDEVVRKAVAEHDGVVFSSMGDGIAAAFPSASLAVKAALAAHASLDAETWATATPLKVRVGVHTGEAELRDGDYFGTAVNRAARLTAIAHGGQVLISLATAEILGDASVALVDLGEHRLRDLDRPIHVFQVGEGTFPALRSLDSFLGNLPFQVSSFVGRQRELVRGMEALGSSRVVTLTGVGGVGKTRLALQLAAEVLPRFRDGAWLVEFAPVRDAERVADAVSSVFGVSARAGQSIDETLIEFLRAKQILLVLDNCEHLLDVVADLVERIERSCGGVVVLATSRESLTLDGERVLGVPSLAAPASDDDLDAIVRSDAVALFAERAEAVDADFRITAANASAVAELCRRLDGIPLAIEIAAARVNAMTPAELARGLDHRFDLLSGGRRRAVQRHLTLRAAIDWSYDLLSESERLVLVRLSVFAGGCTSESAEAVCGWGPVDPARVMGVLTDLVARSLVVAERAGSETRYRLLETIREYGEDRLAEYGETDTVRRRHAEYYEQLVRTLDQRIRGPEQPEALRLLGDEDDNLQGAMAYAVDSNDVDLALRLLSASLVQAVWAVGQPPPLDAVTMAGAAGHPLYPRALATAAYYSAERGEAPSAEHLADAAMDAAAGLARPDPLVEFAVHVTHARTATALGGVLSDAEHFKLAAEATRSPGYEYEHSVSLSNAAALMAMSGDVDRALPLAREALAVARQLGAPTAVAWALMAYSAVLAGPDPDQAKALHHESEQTAALLGKPNLVLSSFAVLIAGYLGDWDRVLCAAPVPVRGFLRTGARDSLAGMLNVVARAIAPANADAAALLQGAVRRLVTPPGTSQPDPRIELTRTSPETRPSPSAAPTGAGRVLGELRQQTTAILLSRLGEARLRELRAEGAAMDDDHVVAVALDAMAQTRAAADD
jgi:predicted ATPase/class 3 adenylate cyclase